MDKEQMLKTQMLNVQQNITTQINIGTVQGNYFQHVENVNIGSPVPPQQEASGKEDTRRKETLFADADTHRKEAKRFVAFLRKEGIDGVEVDTTEPNAVNRAFVAYYRYWSKKGKLPAQPNAAACYRFLKTDCNRAFGVGEKSYVNFIRRMIAEAPDTKLGDMPMKLKAHLA